MLFRLIGRTTVFRVVKQYRFGDTRCVKGYTLDGKFQTVARIKDIIILADTKLAA